MKHRPQLVSPAGNLEKLNFVLRYGADSAYLGGKMFSLRERAGNFSLTQLKQAKKLADTLNKKINVAMNVYFRNRDFKAAGSYCEKLLNMGLNNLIIHLYLPCIFLNIREQFLNYPPLLLLHFALP